MSNSKSGGVDLIRNYLRQLDQLAKRRGIYTEIELKAVEAELAELRSGLQGLSKDEVYLVDDVYYRMGVKAFSGDWIPNPIGVAEPSAGSGGGNDGSGGGVVVQQQPQPSIVGLLRNLSAKHRDDARSALRKWLTGGGGVGLEVCFGQYILKGKTSGYLLDPVVLSNKVPPEVAYLGPSEITSIITSLLKEAGVKTRVGEGGLEFSWD